MAVSSLKDELQGYWELPAIAHFCSLFRVVFKFSEFDIESLEEAFMLDEEGVSTDTRSSLILDTLICLLRGITGRREVSLNNYNRYFYRLLANYWEAVGFGPNPLGPDVTKADYHRLPLYARVKLMYVLCELRLTKSDVEHSLREFSGDSMRVVHLGEDRNGVKYWYFYGTRLYIEDPEIKITIPLRNSDKKKLKKLMVESDNADEQEDTSTRVVRTRRRKRRGRDYDFGLSRKKKKHAKKPSAAKVHNLADQNLPSRSSPLDSSESVEPAVKAEDDLDESSVLQKEQIRNKIEEDEGESPSQKDEPAHSLDSLASAIYAAHDGSSDEERESFKEEQCELKGSGICSPCSSGSQSWSASCDADRVQNSSELKMHDSAGRMGSEGKWFSTDVSDVGTETKGSAPGASATCISDKAADAKPWLDQPYLKPPARRRWRVRCDTLDDWKNLVESLKGSAFAKERRLHDLLTNSFLPEIEKFYEQKKVEKQQRENEIVRRLSERLETRRSLRERPPSTMLHDFFYSGDEEEQENPISEDRRRQLEVEKREQRYRMRALEKEKQEKLKERAREERARRLEMRRLRQGGDFTSLRDGHRFITDKTLNELDIQLELEFMYGQLEKLLYALKENGDAWPFVQPVTEDIAPNYFQLIAKPMDLGTIETKLMNRDYKNKLEFVEDINLMLLNCLEYNGLRNDYTKAAQRLERNFIRLWKRYFPPSQSSDEDIGLNCVASLGALDIKIKEKIREEISLVKQRAGPSSLPECSTNRAQKAPEPKLVGINPRGRMAFRDQVVQSIMRTAPRSVVQQPQQRGIYGRSSASPGRSFRPIAPRVPSEGISMGVGQANPTEMKMQGDQQQTERRSPFLGSCVYLFNATDGNRLARLVGPDGGQPSENATKQAVAWLRHNAHLLPRSFATVTVIVSNQDTPLPLEVQRPSYKIFNVSETVTIAFANTEQQPLTPSRPKTTEASSANIASPNVGASSKSLFVVQPLDSRCQQQSVVPTAPSSSQSVVLPNTGSLQRVSTKPVCSVAPLRSSPEVSGYPSFDQTQATVSNKTSSGSPQSSSTSTSASIAVCDQTIVVLAANQVFVGDSGCYIVSSSPGNVITSQTSTPSTSAIGSSGSNSRGVQIIQVVPQVVVASSSETGLPPSVTYNTISTPDVGEPQ